MPNPIDPSSSPGVPLSWKTEQLPPLGKPLPPTNPWVQALAQLFPDANPAELEMYARRFEQNMVQSIQHTISQMTKKAHEAAERLKRSINE